MIGREYTVPAQWGSASPSERNLTRPIAIVKNQTRAERHRVNDTDEEEWRSHHHEVAANMDVDDTQDSIYDEYDSEMELEGLDWKPSIGEANDRPENPVARQIERSLLYSDRALSGRTRDCSDSKRQRFGSGSVDSSVEGQAGSEGAWYQWSDGTPPDVSQPVLRHLRGSVTSPPSSPCLAPTTTGLKVHPGLCTSPPPMPCVAVPKYYTGGPVALVDTGQVILPQVETLPVGRRSNSVGSPSSTIQYAKPGETRGGSVSPLREVIRKLGIS